jgi:hypothetical protein
MNEVKNQVQNIQREFNSKIIALEQRMDKIEQPTKYNKIANKQSQEAMEKNMDISGIKPELINEAKTFKELKKLAVDVITSLNIEVKYEDIDKVSKRTYEKVKNEEKEIKNIITVVFKDLEKKIDVMDAKRTRANAKGLYFMHTLTPANRYFMARANAIVNKRIKIFYGKGAVRAVKEDKSQIVLDEDSKLDELKNYIDALPAKI